MQVTPVQFLGWRRERLPTPVLWPGEVHGVTKSETQLGGFHFGIFFRTSWMVQMVKHLPTMLETWVESLGWEDPLQKEMATHSSTLAWKIPWMEEPDRLQSMRLQSWTRLSNFTDTHAILASIIETFYSTLYFSRCLCMPYFN